LKNARRWFQSQHLAAAHDLDQKFNNSELGEVGPIEAKIL
jgi:hypothetical protein